MTRRAASRRHATQWGGLFITFVWLAVALTTGHPAPIIGVAVVAFAAGLAFE